jgi:N-acetylmuramoyl-L-alanine amidase
VLVAVIVAAGAAGQLGLVAVAQAPSAAPVARFVVVLDAAHGGDDTGGSLKGQASQDQTGQDQTGQNQTEKAFTLALSVRLRSLLTARGVQVVTTRESDDTVEAERRAEIANHANAQACLSLHGTESGSGVHLFVSSMAPVQPAHFVPWKTAQAAWVTRSLALAGAVNSALLQAGMTVTLGRTALPGVDSMACPAVAVEIAPERGADKNVTADLDDQGYQARVAEALAAALLEWRTEVWRTEAGRTAEVHQP